jgi:hypothetical protein
LLAELLLEVDWVFGFSGGLKVFKLSASADSAFNFAVRSWELRASDL